MSAKKCEQYVISAMAMADGEEGTLDAAAVKAHLAQCPDCRREMAGFERLGATLSGLGVAPQPGDAWPGVGVSLHREAPSRGRLVGIVALAALLPVYKLTDVIAGLPAVHLSKLLPVALALLLFAVFRENPFAIKPAIQPDGDPA